MSDVQTQLALIVEMASPDVSTRLDPLEASLVARIQSQSGLSRAEIIRRCVKHVRNEIRQHGAFKDFTAPEKVRFSTAPDSHRVRGRRPQAKKESELRRKIAKSLKELERDRAALEVLERAGERRAA